MAWQFGHVVIHHHVVDTSDELRIHFGVRIVVHTNDERHGLPVTFEGPDRFFLQSFRAFVVDDCHGFIEVCDDPFDAV